MQQNPHSAGSADSVDYYSTRNLHPRTGDCAAFTGRASGSDVSPRSDFHDDLLTPSKPVAEPSQAHEVPTNADVELEGVTADGGFAVNVGFDNINQSDLSPDEQVFFQRTSVLDFARSAVKACSNSTVCHTQASVATEVCSTIGIVMTFEHSQLIEWRATIIFSVSWNVMNLSINFRMGATKLNNHLLPHN